MIHVKNLSFSYEENHPVLKDVSFSIRSGEFVAIIGHNGSGKSTLAKLLAGLMEVKQGTIEIDGVPLNPQTIQQLRSKLGIVFQNPDNQFIGATVADDLAFGLENRRIPSLKMSTIIETMAKKVGMENFLHQEPTNLSGGQKQRVAIAGILAMQPDIMIFDEATAMLDPLGKQEIHDTLKALRQSDPHLTILMITHDLEEAAFADRILVMNQGQCVMEGKPSEIFSQGDALKAMSLDQPFIYQLTEALPDRLKKDVVSPETWLELIK